MIPKSFLAALFSITALLTQASGQVPEPIKDINIRKLSTNPYGFVTSGNYVYFANTDEAHGTELWRTDGTEAGTILLSDIEPGAASSFPGSMVAVRKGTQDLLYFSASTTTYGTELWVSDGTPAGTILLKDIEPGAGSSFPYGFGAAPGITGKAMFSAFTTANGYEPWITDGTTAGTVLSADIVAGAGTSNPSYFVGNSSGSFIFAASRDDVGNEPFIVIAPGVSASLLKDIEPGAGSSVPYGFAFNASGSLALFSAYTSTEGTEPWKSSGSAGTTSLLKDIVPGIASSHPSFMLNAGTNIFFSADDSGAGVNNELWKTDQAANPANTVKIAEIEPGNAAGSSPSYLKKFGSSKVVFLATTSSYGSELWVSDGASTSLVKDLASGPTSGLTNFAEPILQTLSDTQFVFVGADSETSGNELWISDGTPSGTSLLKNINPGFESMFDGDFSAGMAGLGSTAIFPAVSGIEQALWKTDGTSAGTLPFKSLSFGSRTSSSYPSRFTATSAGVFFSARSYDTGFELYKTDGTKAGTALVKDLEPLGSSDPRNFTSLNGKVVFTATTRESGNELWASDGSTSGTSLLKDIYPGALDGVSGSSQNFSALVSNKMLFRGTDADNGGELWGTDGTAAGTNLLVDINPGITSSNPGEFVTLNPGIALFSASDGSTGTELWKTDGTLAGTTLVKDIRTGALSSSPAPLAVIGGTLLFEAADATNGRRYFNGLGYQARCERLQYRRR